MYFFKFKNKIIFFIFFQSFVFAQPNSAPILFATGNQIYCVGTELAIVTDFSIIDPDNTGIDAIYIQITTDYEIGKDILTLTGTHPTISPIWDISSGKLTLAGTSSIQPTYLQLVAAVKQVVYSSNVSNPMGSKTFSITIGQANYLPSTNHYYQFIPNIGVTWTNAKTLAESNFYYDLQGYLATITTLEEAVIAGEQSNGAGWIGGSDAQQEGVWQWVTGPEVGLIFWNGSQTGSSPNFAYWNANEPNNLGNENYAHITAPGVGNLGSWNDLSNTGGSGGNYQPKGYIVEYGGMPGDPILQISTSTTISIPTISILNSYSNCGTKSFTLTATANNGMVYWYESESGGSPIAIGNSFTTPLLVETKTYYLDANPIGCASVNRTPLIVTINEIPIVNPTQPNPVCSGYTTTLSATASKGNVYWYENQTSTSVLFIGNSYTTPILTQNKTYFVSANNNGCFATSRIAINVVVINLPDVLDEKIEICQDEIITLDAKIPNYSYQWSTGQTTQTIQSSLQNNYFVKIISTDLCFKIKNFELIKTANPKIKEIQFEETSIRIITSNQGDFEYSIDGMNFQDSNEFIISDTGNFTAFVRDTKLCGLDKYPFVFIVLPKFFTPNNDGFNDFFGTNSFQFYPKMELIIMDRFGKLIKQLNQSNPTWDGLLDQNPMPADDYWYVLKIDTKQIIRKGHFSLKR